MAGPSSAFCESPKVIWEPCRAAHWQRTPRGCRFFTAAGGYLLLGFLYKRIVVGAKGLEQIPNYSFWKDCGNLQADGCNYICRCHACGDPSDDHRSYRDIDDRPLRPDEDRDDQLLTM